MRKNQDSNVILANDGSLIISSARVSDSANYTCGARNLYGERLANVAPLSVYGNEKNISFKYYLRQIRTNRIKSTSTIPDS